MKIYLATAACADTCADDSGSENAESILWAGRPYLSLAAAQASVVEALNAEARESDSWVTVPPSPMWRHRFEATLNIHTWSWLDTASLELYLIREYDVTA